MSEYDFTVETEESSVGLVEKTLDIVATVETDDVIVLITDNKNDVVEYDGDTLSVSDVYSEQILIEEETVVEVSSNIAVSVEISKGGQSGGVFISSISSDGIISDVEWFVVDRHIKRASTDTDSVTVTAIIDGYSGSYMPTAKICGIDAVISETSSLRTFIATATIPVSIGDNDIVVDASNGGSSSAIVTRMPPGPSVISVSFAAPASPSTHYKAGDTLLLQVKTDELATSISVLAKGASSSLVVHEVVAGIASFSVTISSVATSDRIYCIARNSFGTVGEEFSSELVPISQESPSVSVSIAYPGGQFGAKTGDIVTVSTTASNFSDFKFTFDPGLSGTDVFEPTKLVSVLSTEGSDYDSVHAVALLEKNGTSFATSAQVLIANVPAVLAISISTNPSRLTRSPLGTSYTLIVESSQPLMSLSVAGVTMNPSANRKYWTGTVKIYDSTPIGGYSITANSVGAAGHPGSSTGTFQVGGFSSRSIVWPAFSRVAPLGLQVSDQSRVSCSIGTKVLTRYTDAADRSNGFYVADVNGAYNPNGSYIALSDAAFAASNTSGTLQGTVQEV